MMISLCSSEEILLLWNPILAEHSTTIILCDPISTFVTKAKKVVYFTCPFLGLHRTLGDDHYSADDGRELPSIPHILFHESTLKHSHKPPRIGTCCSRELEPDAEVLYYLGFHCQKRANGQCLGAFGCEG